jgi:hypothetical protein
MSQKIVINKCYGGFGLSNEAIELYAKYKKIKLYPEINKFNSITWWIVPKNKRVKPINCGKVSLDEMSIYNKQYEKQTLDPHSIERNDKWLVKAVETLGEKANGNCANLEIIEIPDDVKWEIDEYDGMETICEKHRKWS